MLEWTGERFIPSVDVSVSGVEIHYEHLHRYAFASNFVKDKIVLDLASGEGYGSYFLSHFAKSVTGIDIDDESIRHSQKTYRKLNVEYKSGSICDVPIPGEKIFDVIICFEAIEHVSDHDKLLSEILRLLKTDGILILSTPNKKIYSDVPNYSNPFHVKELYMEDLQKLMEKNFSFVSFFGQRTISGSSIFPLVYENGSPSLEFTIHKGSTGFEIDTEKTILPVYFVIIASNKKTGEIGRKKSYLIDPSDTRFSLLHSQINNICKALSEKDAAETALRSQIVTLNQNISERDTVVAEKTRLSQDLESKAAVLTHQVVDLESEITALTHQIAEKDAVVAEKTRLSQDLESEITVLTHRIDEKDQKIREVYTHILTLDRELAEMKQSVLWRFCCKFDNRIIQRVFPEGSKNREKYHLMIRGVRIFANEGFGKLLWHYREREKVKKTEKDASRKNGRKKIPMVPGPDSDLSQIQFPVMNNEIEVSIIIPVYNKFQYTINCLRSISEKTKERYEVVVVDDASTDKTVSLLINIPNLLVIRNDENMGFVESCNKGAQSGKGKYLLFLNNDTVVTENWLPTLVEVMKKEGSGAVGSKLVYPDGTLQEAGGIIWNDAKGWNYGRGDNPLKPEYNFVREVDYCSGAALLVRRDLFERTGGFDPRFKPGYYEDVDLCFSIRALGYKIEYQPESVVIHFEGITSGTDPLAGMKKSQETNRIKFLSKWGKELSESHFSPLPENVFRARHHIRGKNILVIDHYVPTYDKDAGSQRMYQLLKILRDLGNNVTFAGENLLKYEPYTSDLQNHGVEVLYEPYETSLEKYLSDSGIFFDLVIVSRAHIAIKYISVIKKCCPNAKVVFDTVDLQYLRLLRQAEIEHNANLRDEAEKRKKIELNLSNICDATWVVSPVEKELLRKEDSTIRVDIVSDIQDTCGQKTSFSDRKNILFIGGFIHQPNVDAIHWFVHEIFPLIKNQIPDVRLFVIGSDPPADIRSPTDDSIVVTGFVEQVEPYLEQSRIFIAPVRYGAGVKGKINKSMCYGLPVVTTTIGAEGMYLVDRKNALINDDPKGFADNCVELYQNEELWTELSKNSLANINNHFSYQYWKDEIERLLGEISGP